MAIKIIKPGKKPETFRFECPDCGCVFEADVDDYEKRRDDFRMEIYVLAACPSCGHFVRRPCNE